MQHTVSKNPDIEKFSDKQLLYFCKKYGDQTLLWRRKFIGLLPEVNRRGLYERKGFSSIFEFGKRMAGLSEDQIRLALNLEKRFEDKPVLKSMLVAGEVSINKLARVVSIATSENEEFLAQSAKVLSKSSLEVFVRDIRLARNNSVENSSTLRSQNGLFEPQIELESLPGQHVEAPLWHLFGDDGNGTWLKFKLNDEVMKKLNELHDKNLDVNKILLEMLEKREKELAENKVKVAVNETAKEVKRKMDGKEVGRRLSVGVRKVLKQEFGDRCSASGCVREAKHIHHKVPFSISGSHDPNLLAPLCREHHDIVHSINSKYVANKLG
ncbi:MAG: HNH endonuclease signature motif containing protein [Candidatus Peregrinibacteria bacterium]|nr:HNH endonuclease signature motif containing protein [Candidatus Peregrinibacteria bacterium]MDZ4244962.1 HNH endonuclease signature motif containing protein [Candidatus Gracilibacteria bacterium]